MRQKIYNEFKAQYTIFDDTKDSFFFGIKNRKLGKVSFTQDSVICENWVNSKKLIITL